MNNHYYKGPTRIIYNNLTQEIIDYKHQIMMNEWRLLVLKNNRNMDHKQWVRRMAIIHNIINDLRYRIKILKEKRIIISCG